MNDIGGGLFRDVANVDTDGTPGNVDDTYHEVLFTEWIPRAESLPNGAAVFSVMEKQELGELVVTFDIPINLPATRNYVFLIEFNNNDGNFDYS